MLRKGFIRHSFLARGSESGLVRHVLNQASPWSLLHFIVFFVSLLSFLDNHNRAARRSQWFQVKIC